MEYLPKSKAASPVSSTARSGSRPAASAPACHQVPWLSGASPMYGFQSPSRSSDLSASFTLSTVEWPIRVSLRVEGIDEDRARQPAVDLPPETVDVLREIERILVEVSDPNPGGKEWNAQLLGEVVVGRHVAPSAGEDAADQREVAGMRHHPPPPRRVPPRSRGW